MLIYTLYPAGFLLCPGRASEDPRQYTKRLDTEIGYFGHFRMQIYCQTSQRIYPEIHGIVFSLPIESIEYDSTGVSFGDYLETLNISILGAILDAIFIRTQYLTCWCIAQGPGQCNCTVHMTGDQSAGQLLSRLLNRDFKEPCSLVVLP